MLLEPNKVKNMSVNLKEKMYVVCIHKQTNKQTGQCCRQRLCSLSFLFLFFINLYFKKHQSECLFKVVKCSNSGCAMMLSKRDMKTHETSECSWRKVNCKYCQDSVIMNQKKVCDRLIQSILSTLNSISSNPRYLDLKSSSLGNAALSRRHLLSLGRP